MSWFRKHEEEAARVAREIEQEFEKVVRVAGTTVHRVILKAESAIIAEIKRLNPNRKMHVVVQSDGHFNPDGTGGYNVHIEAAPAVEQPVSVPGAGSGLTVKRSAETAPSETNAAPSETNDVTNAAPSEAQE